MLGSFFAFVITVIFYALRRVLKFTDSMACIPDGFKAMVEAAESNPQIAIQYKMVNQWKEIAGEQVKAFEHINLGNITVFDGGQNSTGNFLNNVVKTVAPALGVIDQLPIADTLKKLKGDDKK